MYAFLLVLGAVITAAGLALVASGVSIQDHAFDATNVTPGTIAVIGGCILIGLAFVVRALLRVERALIVRPMPRPVRPGEVAGVAASPAEPSEPARPPFPPKVKTAPLAQPAPVLAVVPPPPAPAVAAALDVSRAPPPLERLENAPMVEESDVSLLPKVPVRSDEENGDIHHGAVNGANGAAQAKTAPRVAVSGRPAPRPQQQPKNSIFDSLWPKAQRLAPDVQATPGAQVAPPPLPQPQPVEVTAPPSPAQSAPLPHEAAVAVSILKSGVVEGMAYTLYSDGSIEAQLPGGTLRFGSITELRNHIEQNG